MSISDEWKNTKYRQTFDEETRGLQRRREHDPNSKIADLEATLKNLYILDGADQGGRGCLQDIVMAAQIAAYEQFITQWKEESK